MGNRGRKSAAALALVTAPAPTAGAVELVERPGPPQRLNDAERELWIAVVNSLPADWFGAASLPVLEQYCVHVIEARRLTDLIAQAVDDEDLMISDYERLLRMRERESRAVSGLATKLRITQQSTINWRGNPSREGKRKPWHG